MIRKVSTAALILASRLLLLPGGRARLRERGPENLLRRYDVT